MRQLTSALGLFIFLTLPSFTCNSQSQQGMRHEFIKRGKHASEMPLGNYTILATSTSETNAKQLAQEIQKSGYTDTIDLGYLSIKKSWYIYISSANDVEKAKAIKDKYRKIEKFKGAWVLTVFE